MMRFNKKSLIFRRKVILILLFDVFLVGILIYSFFRTNEKILVDNKSINHICTAVSNFSTIGHKIKITFNKNLETKNPEIIASYFAYETKSFESSLLSPPNSAINMEFNGNTLMFEFPLPFILNYSGYLLCVKDNQLKMPPFNLPHRIEDEFLKWKKPLNIFISDFREDFPFSQFKCHGDNYINRWCEGRRIGVYRGEILFETPIHYQFNETFLYLGSRPHHGSSKLFNEPYLTKMNLAANAEGLAGQDETTFFNSLRVSEKTPISFLLDYLIPLFITMKKCKIDLKLNNTRFFTRNFNNYKLLDFLFPVIKSHPLDLVQSKSLILMDKVVLGLVKSDELTNEKNNPFIHPFFTFSSEEVNGFRELYLDYYIEKLSNYKNAFPIILEDVQNPMNNVNNTTEDITQEDKTQEDRAQEDGAQEEQNDNDYENDDSEDKSDFINIGNNIVDNTQNIRILFLISSKPKREIVNLPSVTSIIQECKNCTIQIREISDQDIKKLFKLAFNADIIIGRTGLPLESAIWMAPSNQNRPKFLIELRPNRFSCDDRYKVVANMAGVNYLSIMSNDTKITRKNKAKCYKQKDVCFDECYTFLRNLPMMIDVMEFSKLWNETISQYNL
ncbi:hypothetical protein TRFO_16588 [Tritrichomonas foetus]|uniref:Uncharacterized protein n=1 Tax=Tritrichomonas foetus TaxID=1144522 RepID=A0A1J4KPP1_9EUKA|nr:hypothetical protein TRFO_16588 [Tritrichomonas foetus]|eukprot:OHT13273.1 hypothetical protein TRFO_16588 [Tritrichomonas foetus]